MRTASALNGACLERCAPCQQSLAAKLLDEDPIVLAVTAGSVYSLHAANKDAGSLASDAAQLFFRAVQASPPGDGHIMLRCVELLNLGDRAALLEDALDLWTFYGHKHPGLMRGRNTGPESAPSPFTFSVPGSDPEGAGPGTVLDLSGLDHPARYGGRADMTLPGFGRVASVALLPDPESPEAGYADLQERVAWEPYIPEGLPEEDPAWVLKVHETSGALLGIVRLLDATLLPDKPHWEWRPDVYDVILCSAPEMEPVSAMWLETARERGSALLYGPLDLTSAAPLDPSRLLAVHARCLFTDVCEPSPHQGGPDQHE